MTYAFIILALLFAIQTVRMWRFRRLYKQAVCINAILRNANDGLMRVACKKVVFTKDEWPDEIA